MSAPDPKDFFTAEEQQRIVDTIVSAEADTTGEICIRIERRCPGDPLEHCRKLLDTLGISATSNRTGILIYISIEDHKVAIYGDQAIHEKIGNEGWTDICNALIARFQKGSFCDGVCDAIQQVGLVLHQYFPATAVNPDELPNKPSFG